MNRKKILLAVLIRCGVFLLLAAVCLLIRGGLARTQMSQQQAERWAGESEQKYMQYTCFFTRDGTKDLESIFALREKFKTKFAEADLETPEGGSLYCDAWSTTGSTKVSSVHGSATTGVVAVGGSFFDFHPLNLRSGSYLRQTDLMKDRVMLDEVLAWMLFGSPDVAGMEVEIGGKPYQIAGVVTREADRATKKFAEDGPMLYISYEGWQALGGGGVDCYEVVLPEPVDGFTQTVLEENFSVGDGVLQQNTGRYSLASSVRLMKQFGTRGARTSPAVLPYWENAARWVEDWCALLALFFFLFLIFPALCALVGFVWGWIRLRKVLYKQLPVLARKTGDGLYSISSRLSRRKKRD